MTLSSHWIGSLEAAALMMPARATEEVEPPQKALRRKEGRENDVVTMQRRKRSDSCIGFA